MEERVEEREIERVEEERKQKIKVKMMRIRK